MEYCLTEIPKDLGKFASLVTNEVYDDAYWKKLAESIRKENEDYERKCKRMQIDPISGKSTMLWADRNKMFTL